MSEMLEDLPQFHVSIASAERFPSEFPTWNHYVNTWKASEERVAPKAPAPARGFDKLKRKRSRTTAYKTGSVFVVVTVTTATMALSRPIVTGNDVVTPVKPLPVVALVAGAPGHGVKMVGSGRDAYVIADDIGSPADESYGREVHGWDF